MLNERQIKIVDEIRSLLDAIVCSQSDEFIEVLTELVKKSVNRLIPHSNADQYRFIYETEGKIPAIKKYKTDFGLGLIQAKSDIESAAAENGWKRFGSP